MTTRRPRTWVDLAVDENMAAGGSFLENLLLNAVNDLQGRTVVRIIGRLRCLPSVIANSTVAAQAVTLGIGVTGRAAFTAGFASVARPHIMTDFPDDGWLYREQAVLVNQQDSGTVEQWENPEFRFDIRASRKIDRGILYVAGVSIDLLAGTVAIKVAGMIRTLVLD